jgi:hypothetical protein
MSLVSDDLERDLDLGAEPLSKEGLCTAIYASFARRYRERIQPEDIAAVLETLDLSDYLLEFRAPQLQVRRLRFTGAKHLHGHVEPIPIAYDQTFAPGVNVVLIEENEVGKSSIWKTIKFALTGDSSDYDADVRSWIVAVWLTFALNDQPYTIILSRGDEVLQATLVPGEENRSLEEAVTSTSILFNAQGTENVKAELQHFFFNRLGLAELSWTQAVSGEPGEVAERKASWLTYFQALLIPDGGDRYLLCDREHAYGNQAGLILSAFLGLSLTDPLNKLLVEASRTRKEIQHEQSLSDQEREQAEAKIAALTIELQSARDRLKEIATAQQARRRAVETAESNRRILEMQAIFKEKNAELVAHQAEQENLGLRIQQDRKRERQLREAVRLQLHFTGISVTLCPNCDTMVDEEAVAHEQETHACRLCGKPAHHAPEEEIAVMEVEADACERRRKEAERDRDAIGQRIYHLHTELSALTTDIEQAQTASVQGLSYAFPTPQEEEEHDALLTKVGMIQRDLTIARERAKGRQPEIDRLDLHQRVVGKVREALKKEAARRNEDKLQWLGELTQDIARRIGAESVTNLTCSPLGAVQLLKHDQSVAFNGIKNDGERLRVKLAFFLAMMRLGREAGGGRHPGFLIIDQPGSNEMVPNDFSALAQVFRQIDQEFGSEIQVLCFTARPQFAEATDSSRIYGPQAAPFAF